VNAQQPVLISDADSWTDIDTSDYIPTIYSGALDYNLMIAASRGYASEIERLIKKGADIDAETSEGATPLIFATINNKLLAVKTLLYYKPSIDVVTKNYETALLISVKNRYFDIAEALIRSGADIDYSNRQGATPLHYAAIYGYLELVDLLLYYDASIDLKSKEGFTPLLSSIWAGYADIADLLIQNGANMETRDNDGYTPFLLAAFYGDTLIMNMLYKKGVDIYATNKSKHNALTISILANHLDATKLLFTMGDKWSDSSIYEINPYSVASKYRRREMINLLQENNVPGQFKYEIDQIAFSASARFCFNDIYEGISLSFKEPYLNGGFIIGFDTKLWASRLLIQNDEHLYYQYMSKGSVAYAGLFKEFALTDSPERLNYSVSTTLLAGYSFANMLRGTLNTPDNKFMIIPSISFKLTKMNFSFFMGTEYLKTAYYKNGPVWFRIGGTYNYFFDRIRTKPNTVNWY
jgi:ankyrin repeat protein